MRTPLLAVIAPMVLFVLIVVSWQRLDPWSMAAGVVIATVVALFIFVRDDPPQHVQNWGRGAEGERKTERALRRLEKKGWTVKHDIQRGGRANLDHVVRGPSGVFLLETKNLAGTVSFEDGCLVTRQFDDPKKVFRYFDLAGRLGDQAIELSARIGKETGRTPWVQRVVVVWGLFPEGFVEHGRVVYIQGDRLAAWLENSASDFD